MVPFVSHLPASLILRPWFSHPLSGIPAFLSPHILKPHVPTSLPFHVPASLRPHLPTPPHPHVPHTCVPTSQASRPRVPCPKHVSRHARPHFPVPLLVTATLSFVRLVNVTLVKQQLLQCTNYIAVFYKLSFCYLCICQFQQCPYSIVIIELAELSIGKTANSFSWWLWLIEHGIFG